MCFCHHNLAAAQNPVGQRLPDLGGDIDRHQRVGTGQLRCDHGHRGADGSFGLTTGTDGSAGGAAIESNGSGIHSGVLTGGGGGTGGAGLAGGGSGGAGGAGLISNAPNVVQFNTGSITGGQGGDGGGPTSGPGGISGTGVVIAAPGTLLLNEGTIEGGRGGQGGLVSAAGGVGVTATGAVSFENGGTVRGGLSEDGLSRADAIRFAGDNNFLGLLSTSVIEGNVIGGASNSDTLGLTGSTDASFNTALIGPDGQYRNFAGFQKLGTSTWTLTGATTALTPWQIFSGTLVISSDASLGNSAGLLTLDGGTLRSTADIAANRAIALGAANGTLTTDAGTTYTANGVISGTGRLTKAGEGTATLTASNTYTGGTTISGGTLQLGNGGTTGTILGNVTNNATLAFNRSDVSTFGGAISGTGNVQQRGTGTTTLSAVNTYSGGTTVQAGTLAGNAASFGSGAIVNNAALVTDQTTGNGTLDNAVSGAGRITKTGAGTLALSSNSAAFAGSTQVAAGTLAVNGSLGGSLAIGNGATLAGTGSIGNTVVQSGATVAPGGSSIGALNVAGNLTLAQGSIYQLNAAADGRSDLLQVSSAATLQGGRVSVRASGNFQSITSYVILAANGGVSGQFSGATTDMAFLDPFLTYTPQNVTLRLQRNDVSFQNVAQTSNQRVAAGAVSALRTGPLFGAVVQQSAANARTAFDSLSGEVHASLKSAAFEDSRFVRGATLGRLREAFDTPAAIDASGAAGNGMWAQAFNSKGSSDSDGNASSVDRSTSGIFLGTDTRVGDDWRLGVLGGYSHSRVTLDAGRWTTVLHRQQVIPTMSACMAANSGTSWDCAPARPTAQARPIRAGVLPCRASATRPLRNAMSTPPKPLASWAGRCPRRTSRWNPLPAWRMSS